MKNPFSRALAAALLAILCVVPLAAQTSTIGTDTNGNAAIRYMQTDPSCTLHNGTVSGTGVAVAETCGMLGYDHVSYFTVTGLVITVTDATTAGAHGSQKIYTWPLGSIFSKGCSFNLTTTAGSGGIGDTAALVGSLGTVTAATDNATLTSTEADLIASFAGTLTDGAGVLQKNDGPVTTEYDGTVTAEDIWLNVAVPDAGSTASDTLTVSGTIVCRWEWLPDSTP